MSITAALSGPERTRAKTELALEDARIPIVPDGHHTLMHWTRKLDAADEHGFLAIQARDASQLNDAVSVVEKHGWALRMHYQTPVEPKPDPVAATIAQMQAEIAELKAKVGR